MERAMGVEKEDVLSQQHREIFDLFKSLCTKLDSLANFYYTPKPVLHLLLPYLTLLAA
jgi:U3 small nucleolar ribonucleoprotein component